jgi:hypothetical protein
MTQDQYNQARDSGYVGGQVVDDDETGEFSDDEAKPMTRFQKVASALRGDKPDQDSADSPDAQDQAPSYQADADQVGAGPVGTYSQDATGADPDRAAAAGPGAQQDDYWDTQDARGNGQDPAVSVTSPDVPVTHSDADPLVGQDADPLVGQDADPLVGQGADPLGQAGTVGQGTVDPRDPSRTQPDIFDAGAPADAENTGAENTGAWTTGPGNTAPGNTSVPYGGSQDQVGAATLPDVPVTQAPNGAAVTEAPDGAGRHAAAELRPGEAAGSLDNLGDLAYGQLVPDAADFTAQWQQIQFKFVDDPRASVTEAADVVAQVTAKLEAAIQERQRAIAERQQAIQEQQRSLRGRWGEDAQADTETLRETLRMYKAFLDQLIGPKA